MESPSKVCELLTVALATVLFGVALYYGPVANIWLLTGVAGAVSLVAALGCRRQRLWSMLRVRTRDLFSGLLVGLAMVGVTEIGYRILVPVVPGVAVPVQQLYSALLDPPGPLFALPVLVLVVLAEEVVWRGLAFEMVHRRLGTFLAVAICVVLYVLPQLGNPVEFTILVAAVCGLLWTVQRALSNSIVPSLVTHLTWNLGVMVMFPVTW